MQRQTEETMLEETDDADTERSELKTNAHTYAQRTTDGTKINNNDENKAKYPMQLSTHSRNKNVIERQIE